MTKEFSELCEVCGKPHPTGYCLEGGSRKVEGEAEMGKSFSEEFELAKSAGLEKVTSLVQETCAKIGSERDYKQAEVIGYDLIEHLKSLPEHERSEFAHSIAQAMFAGTVRVKGDSFQCDAGRIDPLTQKGFWTSRETWQSMNFREVMESWTESGDSSLEYASVRVAYFAEPKETEDGNKDQTNEIVGFLNVLLEKQLSELEAAENVGEERRVMLSSEKGLVYRTVQAYDGRLFRKRGNLGELEPENLDIAVAVLNRACKFGFADAALHRDRLEDAPEKEKAARVNKMVEAQLAIPYDDGEFDKAAKNVAALREQLVFLDPENANKLAEYSREGIGKTSDPAVVKRSAEILKSLLDTRDDMQELVEESGLIGAINNSFGQLSERFNTSADDSDDRPLLHLPLCRLAMLMESTVNRHSNPQNLKTEVDTFIGIHGTISKHGSFEGLDWFTRMPDKLSQKTG